MSPARAENFFLGSGDIGPQTILVLVNAIYFLSRWQNEFQHIRTNPLPFFKQPEEYVDVQMMNQRGLFAYAKLDGLSIIELPYKGKRLSMLVLLPEELDGLADLERQLSVSRLRRWMAALAETDVSVSLPKFSIDSRFYLNEVLADLGMKSAFDERTDFSGMASLSDSGGLWISNVIHHAHIDVSERGTEAYAVTAVTMKLLSIGSEPEDPHEIFFADHPFLFLIHDRQTGAILFMGRFSDPETIAQHSNSLTFNKRYRRRFSI